MRNVFGFRLYSILELPLNRHRHLCVSHRTITDWAHEWCVCVRHYCQRRWWTGADAWMGFLISLLLNRGIFTEKGMFTGSGALYTPIQYHTDTFFVGGLRQMSEFSFDEYIRLWFDCSAVVPLGEPTELAATVRYGFDLPIEYIRNHIYDRCV